MDKAQQELKDFLVQQLQWCKEQDAILQLLDDKLKEMKLLAEYKLEHELTTEETGCLNEQLAGLRKEAMLLRARLGSRVH